MHGMHGMHLNVLPHSGNYFILYSQVKIILNHLLIERKYIKQE
jgi:hypothetical protein